MPVGKKIDVENCTLGNFANAKKRVLVIGNSFSAAFTQAFDDLVVLDRYAVTITSTFGAAPVKGVSHNRPDLKINDQYRKINKYYWDSVVPMLVNQLRPDD